MDNYYDPGKCGGLLWGDVSEDRKRRRVMRSAWEVAWTHPGDKCDAGGRRGESELLANKTIPQPVARQPSPQLCTVMREKRDNDWAQSHTCSAKQLTCCLVDEAASFVSRLVRIRERRK